MHQQEQDWPAHRRVLLPWFCPATSRQSFNFVPFSETRGFYALLQRDELDFTVTLKGNKTKAGEATAVYNCYKVSDNRNSSRSTGRHQKPVMLKESSNTLLHLHFFLWLNYSLEFPAIADEACFSLPLKEKGALSSLMLTSLELLWTPRTWCNDGGWCALISTSTH